MGKATRLREMSAGLEAMVPRREMRQPFLSDNQLKGSRSGTLNAYLD